MFRPLIAGILLLTWAAPLLAQAPDAGEDDDKPPKIFTTDTVIAATIEAPWRDIERHKDDGDSWQGTFRYASAGRDVTIPVTITTRGLTRLRVCDFPPLRLDFDKEAARGTEFRGAGNLKMVTHCLDRRRFEQNYVIEYLSYRVFNLVSDMSYRVQGLDVSYLDSERGGQPVERFGFLIEDPDDVADRNGLVKLDIGSTVPAALDPLQTTRFMVFQYLIANLDWSVLSGPGDHCCHNARLIGTAPDERPVYPLPYDLDSSGIIDAHYAAPPEGLPVRNLRQRLFRGLCVHNAVVPGVVGEFQAKRPQIMAVFEDEPRLDDRKRRSTTGFVNRFYELIETDEAVREELTDNCRG